jgi:hypothetical protein
MRHLTKQERVLDVSSVAGIMAGTAVLLLSCLVSEVRFLAPPAFAVLLPSLLYGAR